MHNAPFALAWNWRGGAVGARRGSCWSCPGPNGLQPLSAISLIWRGFLSAGVPSLGGKMSCDGSSLAGDRAGWMLPTACRRCLWRDNRRADRQPV